MVLSPAKQQDHSGQGGFGDGLAAPSSSLQLRCPRVTGRQLPRRLFPPAKPVPSRLSSRLSWCSLMLSEVALASEGSLLCSGVAQRTQTHPLSGPTEVSLTWWSLSPPRFAPVPHAPRHARCDTTGTHPLQHLVRATCGIRSGAAMGSQEGLEVALRRQLLASHQLVWQSPQREPTAGAALVRTSIWGLGESSRQCHSAGPLQMSSSRSLQLAGQQDCPSASRWQLLFKDLPAWCCVWHIQVWHRLSATQPCSCPHCISVVPALSPVSFVLNCPRFGDPGAPRGLQGQAQRRFGTCKCHSRSCKACAKGQPQLVQCGMGLLLVWGHNTPCQPGASGSARDLQLGEEMHGGVPRSCCSLSPGFWGSWW